MERYFYIDKKTKDLFEIVEARIRRLQNWGSVESIRRMGCAVERQVGASYVSLKELAECFSPDLKLSVLLWRTGRREEQILAAFLLPLSISPSEVEEFFSGCISYEIAEYFGSLYISKRCDLKDYFIPRWASVRQHPFKQTAVLTGTAKYKMQNPEDESISGFFVDVSNVDYEDEYVKIVAARYKM